MIRKVAVLLPLYYKDSPAYLRRCLESLKNQTYTSFDIYILVDGYVADDLISVVNEFSVEKVLFKKNRGIAFVLNDGLKLVLQKGYTYIARMDADDICHELRLEKQVKYMEENWNVDCLGTWVYEFKEENEIFFIKKMPAKHIECFEFFKKRDCVNHPSVMFRRRYFEKAGLYPEDTYFAEDTMLWANGFKNGCIFANLQESLLFFRLNDNFFERRRGWKHAISIFLLRIKVNKMLKYSFDSYIYALGYAFIKLLPNYFLKVAYKLLR